MTADFADAIRVLRDVRGSYFCPAGFTACASRNANK